ncbi:SAM-dependent methyltransferase [Kribbella italica]|uniref:Cyclopropane fatty-acyl-phospholipid synthase-like methyltransferase n=1 Tax=Kribbella italica TaxID=1540520 RepID=A0A7W9MX08_9ACTN|nr:methyltransferase domain-containing protein [Kribbella italica]MBB5839611.1 cyclopropane fatty-acyl-phospholipid synthase-like methyltransferase [Kribbella italica]
MDDAELAQLLKNDRYPRSAGYPARWMVDASMGPNPLWQAEALIEHLPLQPGQRVLDLGCGTALSSIFLAKEYGVEVWATDLWIQPDENLRRITEAGVDDQVHPIHAEAHALPYAENFFDAVISIGAYHYFGTDDLYLGYLTRFLKPGGRLGISLPGSIDEPETLPPPHLASYWKWDFCAWHSPAWWRHHWEKTGLVTVELADRLPHSWHDWLQWNDACDLDAGTPGREEAQMLRADNGRTLGLTRVIART